MADLDELGAAVDARRRFAPTATENRWATPLGGPTVNAVEISPEDRAWVYDETPSPCPLCGVGPEQSTDPERMWRSVCYCGHPRYYDYKIREKQLGERQDTTIPTAEG